MEDYNKLSAGAVKPAIWELNLWYYQGLQVVIGHSSTICYAEAFWIRQRLFGYKFCLQGPDGTNPEAGRMV